MVNTSAADGLLNEEPQASQNVMRTDDDDVLLYITWWETQKMAVVTRAKLGT